MDRELALLGTRMRVLAPPGVQLDARRGTFRFGGSTWSGTPLSCTGGSREFRGGRDILFSSMVDRGSEFY